jgi:hypothetical protein
MCPGPKARSLEDLVREVAPSGGPLAEIILERADRILAKDGGRQCKRALTDEEVDLLLAGNPGPG